MADPLCTAPADAWAIIEQAGQAALDAGGPEDAMRILGRACFDTLGDRQAHLKPGALLPGERQYFVAGCFFVTPDRRYHMLVGNTGFPPEQERLLVPIAERAADMMRRQLGV